MLMNNFQIKNKSEDVTTIEILGDIGEGWFGEGITMQSVNDQLKAIETSKIELRISSLGGSLTHALAIHDLLKLHPANITTKIIGVTASSGTIVAAAGDEREMSNNALFLIHNAENLSIGNAEDHRENADQLDVFDDRIVNIFKGTTGKRKSQITSLMKEERLITADEAKEFGFINKVFTPSPIMNKISEKEQTEILNKFKDMNFTEKIADIKAWITDNFQAKVKPEDFETQINAKISEMDLLIKDKIKLDEDLSEKVTGLESNIKNKTTENETLTEELKTVKAKRDEFETELNKIKAEKTNLEQDEDPKLDGKETDTVMKDTVSELAPDQKLKLSNIKKTE